MSRRSEIPKCTVQLVLRGSQLHTYPLQRVKTLLPPDYHSRVQFCREIIRRNKEDSQFYNKILWSDEMNYQYPQFTLLGLL